MAIAITLQQYLSDSHIPYEVCTHPYSPTSVAAARAAHVPESTMVKAVMLESGRGYLVAVIPAGHELELVRLADMLGGRVSLVSENRLSDLLPDCETGAVPPIGFAYGYKTVWDDSLAGLSHMYMEGGDHRSLVHLDRDDFARMMMGCEHGRFSHPRARTA